MKNKLFLIGLLLACLLTSGALAAATWKSQTAPVRSMILYDVMALSPLKAVTIGSGGGYNYRTTDAGNNWIENSGTYYLGSPIFYGIHFPSGQIGYTAGQPTANSIFKTTDEAVSWTGVYVAGLAGPPYNDIFFTSTSEGYVCNLKKDGSKGVFKTTDGGANWTDLGADLANGIDYRGLHFISATNGFICGQGGKVYRTSNGGTNWTACDTGASAITLEAVYFWSASSGIVVGSNTVFKTTDSGANWSATGFDYPGGEHLYLQDVKFADPNVGWMAGYLINAGTGLIFKTTDGGENWDSGTAVTMPIMGLSLADRYNAWAVGGGGSGTPVPYIAKLVTDPTITAFNFGGKSSRYVGWSGILTVEGTNFINTATGEFTGMSSSSAVWTSTTLTALVTLTATGVHTLTMYNPDGGIAPSPSPTNPLPTLTAADPATTVQGGAYDLVITGTGFQAGTTPANLVFSLSGITANSVTIESQYRMIVNISVAATAATGTCDITLTNPDGGVGAGVGLFSVSPNIAGPTINYCTPTVGNQGETLNVSIIGSNFHQTPAPTVSFSGGGITVNSVTWNSATSLTANLTIAPTAATNYRTLTVINNDLGAGSKSNAFRVRDPNAVNPTVTSIQLPYVYTGTMESLYITGTGFTFDASTGQGSMPTFDPPNYLSLCNVDYIGTTALRVCLNVDSAAQLGARDVVITNPNGGQVISTGGLDVRGARPVSALNKDEITIYFKNNPARPNVNPTNTMQFIWPAAPTAAKLVFMNGGGQITKAPMAVNLVTGKNNIDFDYKDQYGHELANGIHLINLNTDKRVGKGKLMVIR